MDSSHNRGGMYLICVWKIAMELLYCSGPVFTKSLIFRISLILRIFLRIVVFSIPIQKDSYS